LVYTNYANAGDELTMTQTNKEIDVSYDQRIGQHYTPKIEDMLAGAYFSLVKF
jgi:hypothetical protein